jgi:E3 ubiquitin-protein ligase SHPRH
MDQILDRLIDDAKLKCEEAQRLALMHNNAMAALSKLKVEAKDRGVSVADSDTRLMAQSCKLYLDSLSLLEENSIPSHVVGEALMTGCMGFRSSQKFVRDGKALLDWQIKDFDDAKVGTARKLWSRIDFEGPSKKITQIRARPVASLPQELLETSQSISWILLSPKECVFQVSSAAVGGEFVDVVSFELPPIDDSHARIEDWILEGNFRTNRSKSWRLLVKSYHNEGLATKNQPMRALYCGVEIEFYEADIAGDSLQRLHALHNASISFDALIRMQEGGTTDSNVVFLSGPEMKDRLREMQKEAKKIEALYIDGVLPLHQESQRQLQAAFADREKCEKDLFELTRKSNRNPGRLSDCWDDGWWNDILLICAKYGHPREQFELCKRVHEDLNSAMEGAYDRKELKLKPFPPIHDVTGLYHGVRLRMEDLRSGVPPGSITRCLEDFKKMSASPTEKAILESSQCERCKRDWTWTGPMCAHCKLSVRFNKLVPDRLLLLVLGSVNAWMKGGKASGPFASARTAANVDERSKIFFDVLSASKKEKSAAERAWRIHLDLLNDLDELNMCKGAIRLSLEGEDLTQLADAELNAIVHPVDVASSYMDHGAKQAMALANLRRHKSTLRYLKNQNLDRAKAPPGDTLQESSEEVETCVVCLSSFQTGRSVLSCGHSFHHSCMEKLIARPGNHQVISCPLRCAVRTKRDEVMIATDKRRDDGSAIDKRVEGSWGTKVTRLVADVLDISNLGEKSIVFSQWEDMLDVVEEALTVNRIAYARATSVTKIADSTKRFRASDCSVLLLNVKNGAEGLTLLEATHIFMVEPLMNCGLDSQAINRIHRIGQTCKTHVHRYLIAETIEIKIDQLRMERQEDQLEDSINEVKRMTFKAGGIDGGFSSQEELLKVLQLT